MPVIVTSDGFKLPQTPHKSVSKAVSKEPSKLSRIETCIEQYQLEIKHCNLSRFEDLFGYCNNVCFEKVGNNFENCMNQLPTIPNDYKEECRPWEDTAIMGATALLLGTYIFSCANKFLKKQKTNFPSPDAIKLLPPEVPRPPKETVCPVSLESYHNMVSDSTNPLIPVRIGRHNSKGKIIFNENVFMLEALKESQRSFQGDTPIDPTNRQPFIPREHLYREPMLSPVELADAKTTDDFQDLESGNDVKKLN